MRSISSPATDCRNATSCGSMRPRWRPTWSGSSGQSPPVRSVSKRRVASIRSIVGLVRLADRRAQRSAPSSRDPGRGLRSARRRRRSGWLRPTWRAVATDRSHDAVVRPTSPGRAACLERSASYRSRGSRTSGRPSRPDTPRASAPTQLFEPAALVAPADPAAAFGMLLVDECEQTGVRRRAGTELAAETIPVGTEPRDLTPFEDGVQAPFEVGVVGEIAEASCVARPELGAPRHRDPRMRGEQPAHQRLSRSATRR